MGYQILLYWPNIIGYFRIGLVFAAWAASETPSVFVPLHRSGWLQAGCHGCIFAGVDGWLARRLGQSSRFGAWLDVVVDNVGRGMLWIQVFRLGWLVTAVEWCVFVCNHNARGDHWKNSFSASPHFIQAVMANGFQTPLGTWVVSGLHCLPLWLYIYQWGLLTHWLHLPVWIQGLGTFLLVTGRLLALFVEMWCIWTHVKYLTSDEVTENKKSQ